MRKTILVSATLALMSSALSAQARSAPARAPSLEGVWKIAEVVTTGANASSNSNPQPSLIIFTRGYYSLLSVNSDQPRPKFEPAKDPNNLTDAEKIARYEQWNPFTANAGTYEIKGSTLTRRPIVAKNQTVMTTNPAFSAEFKLEGNTLWVISKSQPSEPTSETRTKLTQVR
jgi:hypothetical protein